ncbi:MAG: hypothetical protein JWO09_777 [Bacteroidetes bacterium]|nr:hypothetical protein [Bacteroidota bacterium]
MNLKLIRKYPAADCVIGELYVDNIFECYTCEDIERPEKIHGVTAIPRGIYEVVVTFSDRFKRQLPLLLNVPGYEGIRIHPGNTAADTEGCILPGKGKTESSVTQSVVAFNALFSKIESAAKMGKIFIEVKGV